MSLIQQIKDDQLTARKEKSWKASALTTLIGEAAMIGKDDGNRETTDAECIAVIKKFIKNMEETAKHAGMDDHAAMEIELLNGYLPQQITGMRLEMTIQGVIVSVGAETIRDMGKVMKVLKDNYDGTYDGREASTIVKELLK